MFTSGCLKDVATVLVSQIWKCVTIVLLTLLTGLKLGVDF